LQGFAEPPRVCRRLIRSSASAGGMLPRGSSSRRWLNQSTHSSVANSTASNERQALGDGSPRPCRGRWWSRPRRCRSCRRRYRRTARSRPRPGARCSVCCIRSSPSMNRCIAQPPKPPKLQASKAAPPKGESTGSSISRSFHAAWPQKSPCRWLARQLWWVDRGALTGAQIQGPTRAQNRFRPLRAPVQDR
jgi:hypothetical protein